MHTDQRADGEVVILIANDRTYELDYHRYPSKPALLHVEGTPSSRISWDLTLAAHFHSGR